MLTEEEKQRYARQLLLDGWGIEAQEKLKRTKAFVAGCGGSGSPILTQLALLGVGRITACDDDVVELSNLNRQFVHCVSAESRIGMKKAQSAKKTVSYINPFVEMRIHETTLTESNVDELVGDSDIIFDSVDKFVAKFALSRCAVRKGIPHVFYGMIDINSFGCIFFPPKAPCFCCLFDSSKIAQVEELQQLATQLGRKPRATPVCCAPVLSSAGFMMTEALKALLGIGEPAYNRFFFFLQKGNATIADSKGFQGVAFWFHEVFVEAARSQGVNWGTGGWRGKFCEELQVSRRPGCECCGKT